MENRAHNKIPLIKDEGGNIHNSHEEIEAIIVQHFRGTAKESYYDRENSNRDFTRLIPRLVSKEDNFNLKKRVTEEEVSELLKEMENAKAPGLDGFNVDFFKA